MIILNLPQAHLSNTHDMFQGDWFFQITFQQSCQARVSIDKYGETRIQGRITIQQLCQLKVWIDKYGETRILLKHQKSCWIKQLKSQNQIKMRITNRYGETRIIPTYRNACKNSENLVHERVPEHRDLMNHLYNLWEVRIWANTKFILTSRKTEIARSVRGPNLQEPRAEDSLTEPYLVQKIFVTW